jgi:predicted O-methyltransferase YrrM
MTIPNRFLHGEMHDFWVSHHVRMSEAMQKLMNETQEHPLSYMQTPPEQVQFLVWLAQGLGVCRYLELGIFTGCTTLAMAEALSEDAYLLACEGNPEFASMAQKYWQRFGVAHKIDLRMGLVADVLESLLKDVQGDQLFDMVYIDADKPGTPSYFDQCCRLVRSGGLIAIDNLWCGGKVFPSVEEKTFGAKVMTRFNQLIMDDPRVRFTSLPIGDGLGLAWVL